MMIPSNCTSSAIFYLGISPDKKTVDVVFYTNLTVMYRYTILYNDLDFADSVIQNSDSIGRTVNLFIHQKYFSIPEKIPL
jgi:hypothetical protein